MPRDLLGPGALPVYGGFCVPLTIVPDPDGYVDRKRAAALCEVSEQCIANWEQRGYCLRGTRTRVYLPVKKYVGRSPRYDPVDLAKAKHHTDERARRPTAARLAQVA